MHIIHKFENEYPLQLKDWPNSTTASSFKSVNYKASQDKHLQREIESLHMDSLQVLLIGGFGTKPDSSHTVDPLV